MSKKTRYISKLSEEMKPASNSMKQHFINLTKSSKRKLHALNIKNKLKLNQINHQIKKTKYNSVTDESLLIKKANASDLRLMNRVTTLFSGVVIVGLSAGLIWMAQPKITEATFANKMQESINAAFTYEGQEVNTKNGTIAYHIPRQFQYRWSIGVNDIIKYKDNEVIMHYNNQYNVVGQDPETYYLLRDENKAAGEEVFYQNFNQDGQNGFVQLVKMTEKYLLTVFVDGTKLSAIIDYEEAPYLAYNMLMVGRTVEVYESHSVGTELTKKEVGVETSSAMTTDETLDSSDHSKIISIDENSSSTESEDQSDEETTLEGQLSSEESKEIIEFDFSSEKRNEMASDGESEAN